MDLKQFHPESNPDGNYRIKDKFNSAAGFLSCRLLEWSGWYNFSIAQRLLGHYRLFAHFKKSYDRSPRDLPAARAYILQYRSSYTIKNFVCRFVAFLYTLSKDYSPIAEYAGINRTLLYERIGILQAFLTDAEADFDNALQHAVKQIRAPSFLTRLPVTHHIEYNDRRTSNQYNSQVNIQPALTQGPKGKEQGVFSKKQLLMLLDLLSDKDQIELNRPNKFDAIAELLFAVTGKPKTAFLEELEDYRNKSLYDWQTAGQKTQLTNNLGNIADKFSHAGLKTIAERINNKTRAIKRTQKP